MTFELLGNIPNLSVTSPLRKLSWIGKTTAGAEEIVSPFQLLPRALSQSNPRTRKWIHLPFKKNFSNLVILSWVGQFFPISSSSWREHQTQKTTTK